MSKKFPYAIELPTNKILTPAETKVAIAYTLGDVGKEVSARLGIAYNTVIRHTQNIYDKAHIRHSTNALVSWFLSENYSINLDQLMKSLNSSLSNE